MALHPQLDQIINAMLPLVQDFHAKGQLAPQAASMDNAGEITGNALVTDGDKKLTVREALSHLTSNLRKAASAREIVASAIFYHNTGLDDSDPPALIALLEHVSGDSVLMAIPYHVTSDGIQYELGQLIAKPPEIFLSPQVTTKPWWRFW